MKSLTRWFVSIAVALTSLATPLAAQRMADARVGVSSLTTPLDRPDSSVVGRPVAREPLILGGALLGGATLGLVVARQGARCQDCMFTPAYVAAGVAAGMVGGAIVGFVVSEIVREEQRPKRTARTAP